MSSNKKISRKAKILPQFSIYSGNKPPLDLLEIQRKSFCDLLERGIIDELSKTDTFRETAKFSGFTQELELVFNPDTYKLVSPNCTPKEAILKGKTYACKLYVQATLTIRLSPRGSSYSAREGREIEKQPSVVPPFSQASTYTGSAQSAKIIEDCAPKVQRQKSSIHLVETTKKPKAALSTPLPFKYSDKSLRYLQSLQPAQPTVSWTQGSKSLERLPVASNVIHRVKNTTRMVNDIQRQSQNGTLHLDTFAPTVHRVPGCKLFSVLKKKVIPRLCIDSAPPQVQIITPSLSLKKKNIKRSTTTFIGSPIIKKVVVLLSNKIVEKADGLIRSPLGSYASFLNIPLVETPAVWLPKINCIHKVNVKEACAPQVQSPNNNEDARLGSFADTKFFEKKENKKWNRVKKYPVLATPLSCIKSPTSFNFVPGHLVSNHIRMADFKPESQFVWTESRPIWWSIKSNSLCELNTHLGWFYTCFVRADLIHNLLCTYGAHKQVKLTRRNQASFFPVHYLAPTVYLFASSRAFASDVQFKVNNSKGTFALKGASAPEVQRQMEPRLYKNYLEMHLISPEGVPECTIEDASIEANNYIHKVNVNKKACAPKVQRRTTVTSEMHKRSWCETTLVCAFKFVSANKGYQCTEGAIKENYKETARVQDSVPKVQKQVNNYIHKVNVNKKSKLQNHTKFTSLICRLPKAAFSPTVHKQISDIMPHLAIDGGNKMNLTGGSDVDSCTYGMSSTDNTSTLAVNSDESVTQRVKIFRPWIFLGELPLMTKRGHFILNGSPRVIVNQMARCPGIYFQEKRRGVGFEQEVRVSADLIPQRGPWLRIQSDWEGRFWARLKREGRVKYATLYEAFQEFEKQYNAPLVSLVTNSSSSFPKSEILAFQERKVKEDRQKKALVRFFKNSTRYSLGKQGRLRINQRVHSSQPGSSDCRKQTQYRLQLPKPTFESTAIPPLSTNQIHFVNTKNAHKKYNRLDWLYVQLMKKSSLLSIMDLKLPFSTPPFEADSSLPFHSLFAPSVHELGKATCTLDTHIPSVQSGEGSEMANNSDFSVINSSSANKLGAPTLRYTIKEEQLLQIGDLMKNKEKKPLLHDQQYWVSGRKDSEELHKFWSSFFSTRSPFQRITNSLSIENVRQFISIKKPSSNAIFALNSNSNLLGKLTAILSSTEFISCKEICSPKVDTKQDAIAPYLNHHLFLCSSAAHLSGASWKSECEKADAKAIKNSVDDTEPLLMASDVNAIHMCLEHLLEGQGFTDDIDHLKNRLVRTSGKLLQQQLELGLDRLSEVMTPLLGNLIQGQLLSSLLPSQDKEKSSLHQRKLGVTKTVNHAERIKNKRKARREKKLTPSTSYGVKVERAESLHQDAQHTLHSLKPIVSSFSSANLSTESGKSKLQQVKKIGNQLDGSPELVKNHKKVDMHFSTEGGDKVIEDKRQKQVRNCAPTVQSSASAVVCLEQPESNVSVMLPKVNYGNRLAKLNDNSLQCTSGAKVTINSVNDKAGASNSSLQQTPFRWLRTSKPVNNAFREFFGSNPLSQYMDQTNPLAEITHKRRLSSMGPGGIKRETAGMEVRGIHPTHYGRVCPIETPEGKNAGLVNSPTVYGRIGKNGFMETPLYQVVESQVQKERWAFFSAQQEEIEESSLATGDTGVTRFNFLSHVPIPVQTANNPLAHFQQVERNRVGYKALSPVQTISIATALIPFLEHDDANRALMGSNMQRQAIPLLSPERPIVGTGFEPIVMSESGQAIQATKMGCVSHVSADKIILESIHSTWEAPPTVRFREVSNQVTGTYSRIKNGDSISNIYCKFFYTREKHNSVWWNRTVFTRCIEPPFLFQVCISTQNKVVLSCVTSSMLERLNNKTKFFAERSSFFTGVARPEVPIRLLRSESKEIGENNKNVSDLMKLVDDNDIYNQLVLDNEQTNSFLQMALVLYHRRRTAGFTGGLKMQLSLHSAVKMHHRRCKQRFRLLQSMGSCIFDLSLVAKRRCISSAPTQKKDSALLPLLFHSHIVNQICLCTSGAQAPLTFAPKVHMKEAKLQNDRFDSTQRCKDVSHVTLAHASRDAKQVQMLQTKMHPIEIPGEALFLSGGWQKQTTFIRDVTRAQIYFGQPAVQRSLINFWSFLKLFCETRKNSKGFKVGNYLVSESDYVECRLPCTSGAQSTLWHVKKSCWNSFLNSFTKSPFFQLCSGNITDGFFRSSIYNLGASFSNIGAEKMHHVTHVVPSHSQIVNQIGLCTSGAQAPLTFAPKVHMLAKLNDKKAKGQYETRYIVNDSCEGEKPKIGQHYVTPPLHNALSTLKSISSAPKVYQGAQSSMSALQELCLFDAEQNLHISKKLGLRTATNLHLCSTQSAFLFKKTDQSLQLYQRSNQETCLSQRPLVREGDWVQKGDFLADCSASHSGDLALGKNVTVAYMPWEGYNFEDAIVISDRLVANDIYTSIHIERYEIKVSKNSQGKERITNQIPSLSSQHLKHLDSSGIARVSSWVQPGDILVGKVVELKRPLSPYERLAWELASRLSPNSPEREKWLSKVWLEDISLRLPAGVCGRVINFQILSTEWSEKEHSLIPLEVHVYLAVKRKIQVGDKLAGRHGNKGIVSIVLPRQDMPYLGDGSSVDMVLNPLGVPSRMNLGQIFECLLGLAGSQLGCNFKVTPFDEIAGGEASRSLVFLKLYQCRLIHKQQWLFTPTFPGKNKLFDGRTGEPFENWVTVGQAYMLKLIHMVDHKIHARSTGPYSLFTRQPVRGRSRRGGQRLGEMEVWAVEGFGAAYTLQEFLTIKSDDLKARAALQRSFYKKNDVTLGKVHISPGNPEAFRVLVSELQALCLHIQM